MNGFNFTLTLDNIRSISMMLVNIFIVWLVLYYVLRLVRVNSKTSQIFKGILFVIIIDALSKFLGLRTLAYFADMFINWGFLALIIIFQPEIRTILEKLGKTNLFGSRLSMSKDESENLVDQIVTAMMLLSKDKTGALISIERTPQSMDEYVKSGTRINADVTAELLTSIFVTTTPLHDGAVIIQDGKIACASAYFPPTSMDLTGRYGARHRAAVGISEVTDAVTIIVSEETGRISITEGGQIRTVDEKQLREYLLQVFSSEEEEEETSNSSFLERLFVARDTNKSHENAVRRRKWFAGSADESEKMEELEKEASRIKLPQNHKHERPKPSYPERSTHARISPVEVTTGEEGGDGHEKEDKA